MKLIKKSILYYLLMSLPLLLIAAGISYLLIQIEVRDVTDESLWKEKINAEKIIQTFQEPRNIFLGTDSLSEISVSGTNLSGFHYSDTTLFDRNENENINYRVLHSYYKYKSVNYLITTMRSTLENEDLTESLLISLLLVIIFLIVSFFFANLIFSRLLWKPFYRTLDKLNKYDIKQNCNTQFGSSSINEFKILNETLSSMTNKILSDYNHLKEFTENASHEIQTPLAVIKSKLELLMQSENLKEDEMMQVQAIDDSVIKLTSLNKALLLLTKIENNQFKEINDISLKSVLEKHLFIFKDIIEEKNIILNTNFENDIKVKMNIVLCDILFTNLVQNSIRHNIENGSITINLNNNNFVIENSGQAPVTLPSEMFARFKKNDSSKDSLGLGLAIVKAIADIYSLKINFKYENEKYFFSILFN